MLHGFRFVLVSLILTCAVQTGAAQTILYESSRLAPSEVGEEDGFGIRVDISADGRRAIVGTMNGNAAYIFEPGSHTNDVPWAETARLSIPVHSQKFGYRVALSPDGSFALVADHRGGYGAKGLAYVFQAGTGTWSEITRLRPYTYASIHNFGHAMALSDSARAVLLGTPFGRPSGNGVMSGIGHFYNVGPMTGSILPLLLPASTVYGGSLFYANDIAISADGTLAILGEPNASRPEGGSGAVHIFRHDVPGAWTESATLVLPLGRPNHSFGRQVSLSASADVALISSAMHHGPSNSSLGAVHVYRRVGINEWIEEAEIRPGGFIAGFGEDVGLSPDGRVAIIGICNPDRQGEARVYQHQSGAWNEIARLKGTDAAAGNNLFGCSVAIGNGRAIVGAYGWGGPSWPARGSAYIFDLSTVVATESGPAASALDLEIYPNPARESSRVRFGTAQPGAVRLSLHDVLGREVLRVHEGMLSAGTHQLNLRLATLVPGVYLLRLSTDTASQTRRFTFVR
jgi:hypothetical protein